MSLNPAKFQQPSPDRVKVEVFPVQFNQHEHILAKTQTPLPLNYFHISLERLRNPQLHHLSPGQLQSRRRRNLRRLRQRAERQLSGHDAKVEYLVAFVKL